MSGANTLNDQIWRDPNITLSERDNQPIPPVPGDEYDYVSAFFKKIMKDETSASTFTQSIYDVSNATKIPVIDLVQSMEGQDTMQINRSMAFYLNNIRSPSTLLGVQNTIRPNYYAGRNVLG
jgi:hypothetical protein